MTYGLTKARIRFAGGTAILALSAGAAMAQQGVEQVVVSSTRLQAAGFDAPTPTTVVSGADLEAQARPNVFDTLTQLPAMQGSQGVAAQAGTTSNGLSGISSLGLRGLSPLRTLVLIDSQRVVAANENGVADVSMLPQMLIQRVDVVTGGASASWGSDAVAGIVNFVTDKKFEGFKANFLGGASQYADNGNMTLQMAAGTSFAGGRGHFEAAAEYSYSAGLTLQYPQSSMQHTSLAGNVGGRTLFRQSATGSYASDAATPAGQPRSVYGPLAQQTSFAAYGLITSGPKAGTTFGSDGAPFPEALAGACTRSGTGTVNSSVGGTCFGTAAQPGDQIDTHTFAQGLVNPLVRGNVYMRLSYDLSPTTEIYGTLLYAEDRIKQQPAQGNSNKSGTMRCDNAYLPSLGVFGANLTGAQTQAACLAAYPGNAISYGSQWANIPTDQEQIYRRQTRRFVVGADGTFDVFGKSWSWDSYFEHGESDTTIKIYNMPLSNSPVNPATGAVDASVSRFNLSQDAVRNADGNIVCRNTIAQQYGCVPWNPFSTQVPMGAIGYFDNQNSPGGTTNGNKEVMTNRQETFSFSVNGAPIEDWAGPVAVAFGYEYREEHYSQRGDPYAAGVTASTPPSPSEPCQDPFVDCGLTTNGALGAYNAGNFHNGRGTFHVNEVFLEVGVPLINDAFWGKADLDIAGRHARYSTAGDANTWKVGFTWDTPIPGIRVRALQSRDIRAPNLSELFLPPVFANGGFVNEFTGNPTPQNIVSGNTGNVNLKPEKAQTTEVGIVWQPDFIPGFQASVDYYRIGVKGAIISFAENTQLIEDLCFTGVTAYCQQSIIHTANGINQSASNPGGPVSGSGQVPSQVFRIDSAVFNAGSLLTDGFDFEASYQFDLQDYDIPGSFVLRSLANHTSKFLSDNGIPGSQRFVESVGNLSAGNNGSTYNGYGGAVLAWKVLETQSYQNDVWGFQLTERWLSGGITTNKNTIVCAPGTCPKPTVQSPTINYNKVDAILYFDIGVNWNVSDKTQVYAKIDNATNIRPPDIGSNTNNQIIYDIIGRSYRIGVRFNN